MIIFLTYYLKNEDLKTIFTITLYEGQLHTASELFVTARTKHFVNENLKTILTITLYEGQLHTASDFFVKARIIWKTKI